MYFLLFQLKKPECNDHRLFFPESFSKEPRDLSIQDNYREIGAMTKELKMHTQKNTHTEKTIPLYNIKRTYASTKRDSDS